MTFSPSSKYVGMIFFLPGVWEDFQKVRKKKPTVDDEVYTAS